MPVQRGSCHWKLFQRGCVHSKGVILLLIWNFVQSFSLTIAFILILTLARTKIDALVNNQMSSLSFLLFPVIGWLADTWLGRYKMVTASLYITMLGVVLVAIAYIIIGILPNDSTASVTITVLFYCGLVVAVVVNATFTVTMLPYIVDQLVGAPAEELSAAIVWGFWTADMGSESVNFLSRIYPHKLFWIITGLVSVTIPVVTHLLLKQWLVRVPVLTNPIKHIAKVLNYARKNKYPRNRSALTYWEDDYPSRVDLGKNKYGGPFTEEEVEDVKTVLRLLPLLIPLSILELFNPLKWPSHYRPTTVPILNQAISNDWSMIILLSLYLIWQLLVYPFLYSYMPSMLKRIGTGLFILLLVPCAYMILELIGHSMDHSVGCFLGNSTASVLPISVTWLIIPMVLNNLGIFILSVTSLEFIAAQAPIEIRALMIGLWFAVNGFISLVGSDLQYAFNHIPSFSFPSCAFYYFMSKMVIHFAVFLLFVFLSRRYRLRERNIPVNYHLFAENYYDKYINIARELERQGLGEKDYVIR